MKNTFVSIVLSYRKIPKVFEQFGTYTPLYTLSHPKENNTFISVAVFGNTGCQMLC